MSRRISVMMAGLPHPSRGASSVLFYWYIHALKSAGYELQVVPLLPAGKDIAVLTEFANALSSISTAHNSTVQIHPVEHALPILAETRFGVRENTCTAATGAIQAFNPDVILAFDLDAAAIARGIRTSLRIVWLGDLHFDGGWYHFLYGLRENPLTLRYLAYAIARRIQWRATYARILDTSDVVIASSASSVPKLSALGITSEYQPYPWPSDGPTQDRILPAQPTFLFFGSLVGLGSRSSFHFLFSQIFPLLEQRWGGAFEILISGRETLPAWVAKEIKKRPQIRYLGFVENIDDVLSKIHGIIAPIDVPVGNRSRILTALAKQVPVIAHANVALGNPGLVDGETCLLAKDGRGFADRMIQAAEDPISLDAMRQRGETLYLDHFSPRVAADQLVRTIEQRFSTLSVAA